VNLDEFRQWYDRCRGAQVTTTVTKYGQVIDQTTTQNSTVVQRVKNI
jgi:hypothetical protein